MTLHFNLPIYKEAYALFQKVITITRDMPRDFRASVGGRLRDEALDATVLIFRANKAKDKLAHLDALIERVEVLGLLLRLSMDMKFISRGQYAEAIQISNSVGKQANGWRKSQI
jgi:hypothetical protein